MSFIVQPVEAPSIFKTFQRQTSGGGGNVDFLLGEYDALVTTGFASATTVLNITQATGFPLNTAMATGDSVTLQYQIKNSATNFSIGAIQIDSGAGAISLSLPDGLSNFTGYPNALTTYNFEVFKTNDNEYLVDVGIVNSEQYVGATGITVYGVSASLTASGIQINFQTSGSTTFTEIYYQAQTSNGNIYQNISSSPFNSNVLTTGAQTIQVAPVYPAGFGAYSSASNSVNPQVPSIPTMNSASVGSSSGAVVSFTPGSSGWAGAAVVYYAVSSPSGITSSSAAAPITVNGLTTGTNYTFTVYAENALGASNSSNSSNSINTATYAPPGQIAYTSAGTYSFIAPTGVTEISVVSVGGGGGGSMLVLPGDPGGLLGYYTGSDGADSYFVSAALVAGLGGKAGVSLTTTSASGGSYVGDGGGNGGNSPVELYGYTCGGGGAGGYSGSGGTGGQRTQAGGAGPTAGAGGGGGGGSFSNNAGYGGGGVGILGQGANGTAGGGGGGSGGSSSGDGLVAGVYGGGGGISNGTAYRRQQGGGGGGLGYKNNIVVVPGNSYTVVVGAGGTNPSAAAPTLVKGGVGAVRIIWRGNGTSSPVRAFPSTNTGDL